MRKSRESFALRLCQSGGRLMTYLSYFLLIQTAAGMSKSMEEQAKQSTTPTLILDPPTNSLYLVCPPDAKTIVLSSNLQALFNGAPRDITQDDKDRLCKAANKHMSPGEQISEAELQQRQSSPRFDL